MVKITNGSRVTTVTRGAFEEIYKPSGWRICDLSKEDTQPEYLPEEGKISEEEAEEMPNLEALGEEDTLEETEMGEDFDIPISEMKVSELRTYAEKHGIDISAAKTKQDIRAIIRAEEA